MLGAVRGDGCNLIQGQMSQLVGLVGSQGPASHRILVTWSGHEAGPGRKQWHVRKKESVGVIDGTPTGVPPCERTRKHVYAAWGCGQEETSVSRFLGVGPTFYTSLLDGGGVVGLGVRRVAEARGGVSTRWVKAWLSFST